MNNGIPERNPAIDAFRGLTILLMFIVNYLSGIEVIPAFLKHAPDIGLTVTDLIAPAFIFAIGLTYQSAFERRQERGNAYYHFITRFLAIAGIGALFAGGAAIVSPAEANGAWGVLQAIGAAGLITLVFIRLPSLLRLVCGLVLLAAYQFMLDNFWLNEVLSSVQGGLMASLSWGSLMILSTSLFDLYKKNEKKWLYALASLAVLLAGIASSFLFSVSKHRVSFSYILISAGAAACVFYIIDLITRRTGNKITFLRYLGYNPLFLYIVHMLLLGVTFLPGNENWYAKAPLWSALLQLAAFLSILFIIARALYKRNITIKI